MCFFKHVFFIMLILFNEINFMSIKYADTYCILYIEYKQYNRMFIKCAGEVFTTLVKVTEKICKQLCDWNRYIIITDSLKENKSDQ